MPSRTPSSRRARSFATRFRRDGSLGLRRFDRSVKKRLDLGKAVGDEGAQLPVVRRHLKRRIDQKTASPFAVVHRTLDNLLDETADGLFWRQRVFKPLDQRPRRMIEIVFKRLHEQRVLVAVSIVKARRRDPHFVGKIAHRRRLIAAMPETLHRRLQGGHLVKFPRPRHLTFLLVLACDR